LVDSTYGLKRAINQRHLHFFGSLKEAPREHAAVKTTNTQGKPKYYHAQGAAQLRLRITVKQMLNLAQGAVCTVRYFSGGHSIC
jgi:hypothetical protein